MNQDLLDDLSYLNKEPAKFIYVGFWKRVLASFLDVLVAYVFFIAIFVIVQLAKVIIPLSILEGIQGLIALVFMFTYYPLFESSKYQATPGKQVLKIKVIGENGQPISYLRALSRFWTKFLSYIIFFIGFVMVAFSNKNQGLHDMICSTYVIENKD